MVVGATQNFYAIYTVHVLMLSLFLPLVSFLLIINSLYAVLADDRHWKDVFRALSTWHNMFFLRGSCSARTHCVYVCTYRCCFLHAWYVTTVKIKFTLPLFSRHSISRDISELFADKLHFCCLELFSNINILHYLLRLSSYFVNIVSLHITVRFH